MASSATRLLRSFSSLRFIAQVPFPYPSAHRRALGTAAASTNSEPDARCPAQESDDAIYMKQPSSATLTRDESSVSMPMAFMTGSIVGKRFYKEVTTRLADDGNGWTVMLDYRTLKTPSKRPLKLWSLALAKAIAAEWDYQKSKKRKSTQYSIGCSHNLGSSRLSILVFLVENRTMASQRLLKIF